MRRLTDLSTAAVILVLPLLAAGLSLAVWPDVAVAAAAGGDAPGKQVFLAKKCQVCHSIDSLGIARTSKSEKTKGPDLSNVGATHLAPWIMQWLQTEVGNSEGKKHSKAWTGTEQELKQLAEWLATLKKA
jgi:mono/diheme cytochrome c family protein